MAIDPITGGEELAGQIVTALQGWFPSQADKDKAQQAILTTLQASDASQNQVNAAEAANPNLFVAGGRPFIIWICGLAILYTYILVPIGMWVGFVIGHPIPKPPVLDSNLWELMFGMLGLGGMRTWEKIKGVAK